MRIMFPWVPRHCQLRIFIFKHSRYSSTPLIANSHTYIQIPQKESLLSISSTIYERSHNYFICSITPLTLVVPQIWFIFICYNLMECLTNHFNIQAFLTFLWKTHLIIHCVILIPRVKRDSPLSSVLPPLC